MYRCLKYSDNTVLMKDCHQLREDGHCLYCPFYQSDELIKPSSDETKKKVLEKFIEVANIAKKK